MATQLKRDLRCSDAEWAARQDLAAAYRIGDSQPARGPVVIERIVA